MQADVRQLTKLVATLSAGSSLLQCELALLMRSQNTTGTVVQNSGAYCETEHTKGAKFDAPLADGVVDIVKASGKSEIGDFGGRMGRYTDYFRQNGMRADCYDGAYKIEELTQGLVKQLDLSVPQLDLPKYPWIMCLEVGEHIPPEREHFFADNLDRSATHGVILSWASKDNEIHVNLKKSEEVIRLFEERYGWRFDAELTKMLRSKATLSWFRTTLHVFHK